METTYRTVEACTEYFNLIPVYFFQQLIEFSKQRRTFAKLFPGDVKLSGQWRGTQTRQTKAKTIILLLSDERH